MKLIPGRNHLSARGSQRATRSALNLLGFLALFCAPLTLSRCSIDPISAQRGSGDGSSSSGNSNDQTLGESSLAAFEKTVYPLVRAQTCGTCHLATQTPFFAADSAEEAHNAVIDTSKVDFDDPSNSRLVLRLNPESHNCWGDCSANAQEMLAAITEWKTLMAAGGGETFENSTEGLNIADAVEKDGGSDGAPMIETEAGVLTAPMRIENVAGTSGGRVISTPNNNVTAQVNTAGAGRSTHTFEVDANGNYFLFGLVNAPTAGDNSFFVKVDNGAFLTWRTDVTAANFAWDLASDADAGGNILQFQLTAGAHTLEIRQREDGGKIDAIAFSTDMNFSGGTSNVKRKVLRYDISSLCGGEDVQFEIEAEVFDAFSYVFKNPTIVSKSAQVYVKDVKILINGTFSPENATFTIVDQTVSAPGGILSPAAMVAPKVLGEAQDQISVAFGSIEVKN